MLRSGVALPFLLVAIHGQSSLVLGQNEPAPFEPGWSPPASAVPADPLPVTPDASLVESLNDVEVLASGPVHEAFAEAITYDPQPGAVIPRQPPEPVNELPPETRPEGENVEWIPGYWAWNVDQDDFVWVTGVYRIPPPGRRWVPGYWTQVDRGFQWVSGFWAPVDSGSVTYLPSPPEALEQGPSSPAPGVDYFWVPGCWEWRQSNYAWRAGYWAIQQPNWIWIPSHYCWTPRGCVYVSGFWDLPWISRGICYAPVYYRRPLYLTPTYYYRPAVAFNVGNFGLSLFINPGYRHYYFGDYFGASYRGRGFLPWYSYHRSRWGCDPFFSYYRWDNQYRRRETNWETNLRQRYARLDRDASLRPPRTFHEAQRETRAGNQNRDPLAISVDELSRHGVVRTTNVDRPRSEEFRRHANEIRDLRDSRQRSEVLDRAMADSGSRSPGTVNRTTNRKALQRWSLPNTARSVTAEAVRRSDEAISARSRGDESRPERGTFGSPSFRGRSETHSSESRGLGFNVGEAERQARNRNSEWRGRHPGGPAGDTSRSTFSRRSPTASRETFSIPQPNLGRSSSTSGRGTANGLRDPLRSPPSRGSSRTLEGPLGQVEIAPFHSRGGREFSAGRAELRNRSSSVRSFEHAAPPSLDSGSRRSTGTQPRNLGIQRGPAPRDFSNPSPSFRSLERSQPRMREFNSSNSTNRALEMRSGERSRGAGRGREKN